ncbi:metal-sensitive transcriptional regulator [Candidatus Peregrinibacteria bacterium]|nr:metal-sensitive transcriptional regulator [Candidatus Peregrinibacteria bacterium]
MKISPSKEKSLKLSKQAQGMLNKVILMIEEDKYCPDIIQQLDSVSGFLKSAKRELLTGHLDSCAYKKMTENKEQAIKELLKIYNLSN